MTPRSLERPWTEKAHGHYGWFCLSMRHDMPEGAFGFDSTADAATAARRHLAATHAEPVVGRPFWSSAAPEDSSR